MKKKWINLKRRWRKMHKSDRSYFACMGHPHRPQHCFPAVGDGQRNKHCMAVTAIVDAKDVYSLIAQKYQARPSPRSHAPVVARPQALQRTIRTTDQRRVQSRPSHSKYKKLEYDYRQLKKQVKNTNKQ